jgi:type I restriction enzyme M protein
MVTSVIDFENHLWQAVDQLSSSSSLGAQECFFPILGLFFLRYADLKFSRTEANLQTQRIESNDHHRQAVPKIDYWARGVTYVPAEARFQKLLHLAASANLGHSVNEAMEAIERENPALKDFLPKTYTRFNNRALATLLKGFDDVLMNIDEGDFDRIYEYVLGNFAAGDGQRGSQFLTTNSNMRWRDLLAG